MPSRYVVFLLVLTAITGCSSKKQSSDQTLNQQYEAALRMNNLRQRGNELVRLSYKQSKALDPTSAERSLEAARKAAAAMQDPRDQCELLNYVVHAFGSMKRPSKVKQLLGDMRKAADKISQPSQRAAVFARMAESYERHAESARAAKNLFEECETLIDADKDVNARITALMEIGYRQSRLNRKDEVTRMDGKASELAKAVAQPRARAEAYLTLATGFNKRKDKLADTAYKNAEASIGKIDEPLSQGHAWLTMAKHLKEAGQTGRADTAFANARTSAEQVKDASLRKPLLDQIGAAAE